MRIIESNEHVIDRNKNLKMMQSTTGIKLFKEHPII